MQTPQEDYPRDMVQREEVAHQGDSETRSAVGKPVRIFIGAFIFIICSLFAFAIFGGWASKQGKSAPPDNPQPQTTAVDFSRQLKSYQEIAPAGPAANVAAESPAAAKKRYIASTKKIGAKGAPIFYKDFLKNPSKYEGQQVSIRGKVLQIDEKDGNTGLQLIITSKYDSVMVAYSGTIDVYQDDFVIVYGEVSGTVDGVNRMGAAITWPSIVAKHVVKSASGE